MAIGQVSIDTSLGIPGCTRLYAYDVAGVPGAALAISLKVTDCALIHRPTGRDVGVLWFLDPHSESWATLSYSADTDTYDVRQAGPRQLWDEIETAHQWWIDADHSLATEVEVWGQRDVVMAVARLVKR